MPSQPQRLIARGFPPLPAYTTPSVRSRRRHMIQIWTLLGQGFGFLPPAWSLALTFGTALPNYYYYSQFALAYDGDESKPPLPLPACGVFWKDFERKRDAEAKNWKLTFGIEDSTSATALVATNQPAPPGAGAAAGAGAGDGTGAGAGAGGGGGSDEEQGGGGAPAPGDPTATALPVALPPQQQPPEPKDAGKKFPVGRERVAETQPCRFFGWCMPVAFVLACIFVLGPILLAGQCSVRAHSHSRECSCTHVTHTPCCVA